MTKFRLFLIAWFIRLAPKFCDELVETVNRNSEPGRKAAELAGSWTAYRGMLEHHLVSELFDEGWFPPTGPGQDESVLWKFGYIHVPGKEDMDPIVYEGSAVIFPTEGWKFERLRVAPDRSGFLKCKVEGGRWVHIE